MKKFLKKIGSFTKEEFVGTWRGISKEKISFLLQRPYSYLPPNNDLATNQHNCCSTGRKDCPAGVI